jgi:hypothetical protein
MQFGPLSPFLQCMYLFFFTSAFPPSTTVCTHAHINTICPHSLYFKNSSKQKFVSQESLIKTLSNPIRHLPLLAADCVHAFLSLPTFGGTLGAGWRVSVGGFSRAFRIPGFLLLMLWKFWKFWIVFASVMVLVILVVLVRADSARRWDPAGRWDQAGSSVDKFRMGSWAGFGEHRAKDRDDEEQSG